MPYIRLVDFDMYFEDEGTGEPIVFIHGSLTTGNETFKKQIELLKNAYRCVCVDLRGHGKSFWNTYDWNTETLSDDIIKLIDNLNIEKAHLIGHSMGGDIAMNCAITHPDRVKTITVISTAGMVNDNIAIYLEQLHPDRIDKNRFARFIDKMKSLYGENWERLTEHTIWNCSHYPCFSEKQIKQIAAPFLLIRGDKDSMVLDSEVNILSQCVSNFKYKLIENANHFLHSNAETVTIVNKEIVNFLKEVK